MNSFPNLLLEAFFVGVPLVVSDLPSFREIMDHQTIGLSCRPGDVAGLTAQMNRLLDDRALAAQIVEAQRRIARERFDPEQLLSRYEQVFEEAVH